jgi:hypothetical protein
MDFSPEKLRKRFKELTDKFEPKAEARDAIKRERDAKGDGLTAKQAAAYDAKIRKANEGLYELEMERAAISRALGGRTAEPAE